MTCRSGTPCTGNYHSQPFTSAKLNEAAVNGPLVWPCIAEGCPCTASWNGMAGEHCCKTCRGGIPCAADYHSVPAADASILMPPPNFATPVSARPTGTGWGYGDGEALVMDNMDMALVTASEALGLAAAEGLELEQSSPHKVAPDGTTIFDPDGDIVAWPWEAEPFAQEASHRRFKSERRLGEGSTKKLKPMPSDELMHRALMESTADGQAGANSTGMRAWKEFCAERNESWLCPIDPSSPLEDKLEQEFKCMQFVCELVQKRGIKPPTAANYFSQVQGYMTRACGVKLCGDMKLRRLPQMLKGLRRIVGDSTPKVRRGCAAQNLRLAMDILLDPNQPQSANVRAAIACAFVGLMRAVEYCDTHKSTDRKSVREKLEKIPTRADIKDLTPSRLVFMICPAKNMQHLTGKTVPIVAGAGGKYIDAVAEVHNMLRVDPANAIHGQDSTTVLADSDVPMFRNVATNEPLTYDYMHDMVKKLMQRIGEDPTEFGTHSLRIGGATAMFAAGASETVIRTMGRWSSDCYRLYVRACFESSLSWTVRAGDTAVKDIAGEFDEVEFY